MYSKESTLNPLGFRPWQSRLGYYRPARFAVPTTDLSGLGASFPNFAAARPQPEGWRTKDGTGAPVPRIYAPAEMARTRPSPGQLSGPFIPPGPPARSLQSQNASTYRINPATGQYEFYSTDILPRGVWQRSQFQPQAPAARTPLGAYTAASGSVQVQLPGGQVVQVSTSPAATPAGVQIPTVLTQWLDAQFIPGLPNKYLALGFGALFLLRGRR